MLYKIISRVDLNKIIPLFEDIQFYMGYSILAGVMKEAYVDEQ